MGEPVWLLKAVRRLGCWSRNRKVLEDSLVNWWADRGSGRAERLAQRIAFQPLSAKAQAGPDGASVVVEGRTQAGAPRFQALPQCVGASA